MRVLSLLVSFALIGGVSALVPNQVTKHEVPADLGVVGRRQAFQSMFLASATFVAGPTLSNALDMDSFINSELENDQKNCDPKKDPKCMPKMSADEALCKYGQSGNARGEACKRYKASGGSLPSSTKVKSLGGAYAM